MYDRYQRIGTEEPDCVNNPWWRKMIPLAGAVTLLLVFLFSTNGTATEAAALSKSEYASLPLDTGTDATTLPSPPMHQELPVQFTTEGHLVYDGVVYKATNDELEPSTDDEGLLIMGSSEWWLYTGLCLTCTLAAALAAGLTMGMVSLDVGGLRVIEKIRIEPYHSAKEIERIEAEKKYAKKLLPLVSRHHLLLVTLLLMNSLANEALPIFLDRLVPSYLAIILSVTIVLFFGEIIPSSIFTGPNQLRIAASLAWFVWMITGLFYIVAKPISALLDCCIDENESNWRRSHLKAVVELQKEGEEHDTHGEFSTDEINIIHGAFEMRHLTVNDAMINLRDVFMVDMNQPLNKKGISMIAESGHSRVPVYDGYIHNVRGFILVKRLITVDPTEGKTVADIYI